MIRQYTLHSRLEPIKRMAVVFDFSRQNLENGSGHPFNRFQPAVEWSKITRNSKYLKIGPNLQLIFSLVFEHLVGISKFELGKKEAFWGRVI